MNSTLQIIKAVMWDAPGALRGYLEIASAVLVIGAAYYKRYKMLVKAEPLTHTHTQARKINSQ